MPDNALEQHRALLAAIVQAAGHRHDRSPPQALMGFAQALYAGVPGEDLAAASAADRAGGAQALFDAARQRQPGAALLQIFNPDPAECGWASPHTVILAINDDMPFLVDSLTAELVRREIAVHLLAHPVVAVQRDGSGLLQAFGPAHAPGGRRESMIYVEIDRQPAAALEKLRQGLLAVLADVRDAVGDWQSMRGALASVAASLPRALPGQSAEDMAEIGAFLEWLGANHFTFLGYRRYRYIDPPGSGGYALVPGAALGVLRHDHVGLFETMAGERAMPEAIVDFAAGAEPLLIVKADRVSTVHRAAALDVIVVKDYDADGRAVGEHRFAGLFTSTAYYSSPRFIPLLRRKVEWLLQAAGFDPAGHDGKALLAILESFPREELFQYERGALLDTALGIIKLQERPRTAVFVRQDALGRYVSCLVYTPRERYDSALRQRFGQVLEQAFGGKVASYSPFLAEDSPLARVLFVVRVSGGVSPWRREEIELRLVEAARNWRDRLRAALVQAHGEEIGLRLLQRYAQAFHAGYREGQDPATAVADIDAAEHALNSGKLQIALYRHAGQERHGLALKLLRAQAPITLSDVLPVLENMGLRVIAEVPHLIEPQLAGGHGEETVRVYLHDFWLETMDGGAVDLDAVKLRFQTAFAHVWGGDMESDRFNRLVLNGGLQWREVALLRAYCKYLRQAGIPFSQNYMEDALNGNAGIAALLAQRFEARFDPEKQDQAEARCAEIDARISAALEKVASLDQDRILRRFWNAIAATLRTNFFQTADDGWAKPWISFKLDSHKIDELPLPRPMVEVSVYSPRMEGIHLRGGKVARGGIRWSDRREDFRTEILGLMKAQMVKNAVIVPVGSKGGFVVKRPPSPTGQPLADREAMNAEVVACYSILMDGLLDITDNLVDGRIVPPARVVRLDGDDPYLVVAADKGTATFSDIANGIARDYGFWLGDAFASGGSVGYDHKKMAITARGAWECVKRHFRELGLDTQTTQFTAVGVGDMSGDVFGNGMLRSDRIRLLAAFDHRHIFLDPDPADPAASFAERQRLFDLPRSSWDDYAKALISPGGGVFARSLKSIPLSAEVRAMLDLEQDRVAPDQLIQAILKARVDLLFFGGIGTYVKASTESNAEAGDRANDAHRIDGRDIRAHVVGEGANLGVTQRGRIEAAQAGIKINTDAMDNSAGVDCSDHEVNIKIALANAVKAGALTMEQRDELLPQMTEEVAALVLRDNYQQSQAISVAEAQAPATLAQHARMMRNLELAGKLDRAVEFLPEPEEIARRQANGRGLTRPELCVLLAYAKIALNEELLESDLPDDPLLEAELLRYFPPEMSHRFRDAIDAHRLRRNIVATRVVNSMINRVGSAFVDSVAERTGARGADIARAYALARDIFALRPIWERIEALDAELVARAQIDMLLATQRLVDVATVWLLRNLATPFDARQAAQRFAPQIERLRAGLPGLLPQNERVALDQRVAALVKERAPQDLAERIAALESLGVAPELVRLAERQSVAIEAAARVYFAVGERFGIAWLRQAAQRLPRDTQWQGLAVGALLDDLATQQAELAASLLAAGQRDAEPAPDWLKPRQRAVERLDRLFADLRGQGHADLAMLTVAARELRALNMPVDAPGAAGAPQMAQA